MYTQRMYLFPYLLDDNGPYLAIFRKYPTYVSTYLPIYAQAMYTRCIMKSQKTYQTRSCARYTRSILRYKPRILLSLVIVVLIVVSKAWVPFLSPWHFIPAPSRRASSSIPDRCFRWSRSTAILPVHPRKILRDETSYVCMQQCAWNRSGVLQLLQHWCRLSLRSRSLYSSSLSLIFFRLSPFFVSETHWSLRENRGG